MDIILKNFCPGARGQESFKCPDDFGFYPHQLSCDKYWKCDDGVAELKTCGNGLAFDATDTKFLTENCDYLHNIQCGERTQLEPAISAPHCERLHGIFADDKDCSVFWNCWKGEASRYQCSPGLGYDREARVCMWADQVPECRNDGTFFFIFTKNFFFVIIRKKSKINTKLVSYFHIINNKTTKIFFFLSAKAYIEFRIVFQYFSSSFLIEKKKKK